MCPLPSEEIQNQVFRSELPRDVGNVEWSDPPIKVSKIWRTLIDVRERRL